MSVKKYELASPGEAPATLSLLLDVSEIDDPKSRFLFYENGSFLVIYNSDYGSDSKKVVADQIEVPLPALAWLKDTLENGFRKPASAGGFSNTKHGASGTFDGEEVLIVRAMYAGTDKPGFNIVNKSRLSHILAICPQSISFTDKFVDQYLLPLLEKQISKEVAMKSYGLIRPDNFPPDINIILDVPDLDDPKSRKVFYKDSDHLIIYRSSYGNNPADLVEGQIELPLSCLSWISDSIENGFWKPPSEGGLPKKQHGVNGVFSEEEVLIVRSMYAGTDKPGFKIVNKSRSSHNVDFWPQRFVFTDEFAGKYVIPLFKSL